MPPPCQADTTFAFVPIPGQGASDLPRPGQRPGFAASITRCGVLAILLCLYLPVPDVRAHPEGFSGLHVTIEMEKTVGDIVELQLDEQPLPVESVKAFPLEVGLIEIDVDYRLPASTLSWVGRLDSIGAAF